jgi:group II intron reverse transcriptase/maturase
MKDLETPDSVRNLQRKLYLKSKKEKNFRFYSLYDKVYRIDVLKEAWRKVKANKGSAGIDNETIEMVAENAEGFLINIQDELKAKTYKPAAVKRVMIPKRNGGQRPLGIPTVKDRVVQMAVKIIIEPIFEADFEDNSFGFRPQKNAHQALGEVCKYLNYGLVNVVDADIDNFFNEIPHKELLDAIRVRIVDKWILKLIKMWLKSGVMKEGNIKKETTGTPQGGVISPLLANVYLNELDKYYEKMRKSLHARMVRYADDLVILTEKNADIPLLRLKKKLSKMGLKLNSEKTKVLSAESESFDFLGFTIKKIWNRKRTKKFPLTVPSHKAVMSVKAKIREITRRRPVQVEQVIKELNPVLRGWMNYFRVGNSGKALRDVRYYAELRIRLFIRRNQGRRGYGWKEISKKYLLDTLGLYNNVRVKWQST